MTTNLHEYTVYIPVTDNAGVSTIDARNAFERSLLDLFGGFTLDPFEKVGAWRDPESGTLYTDKIVSYQVALAPERYIGELVPLVKKLKTDTRQECVYVKQTSTFVQFID